MEADDDKSGSYYGKDSGSKQMFQYHLQPPCATQKLNDLGWEVVEFGNLRNVDSVPICILHMKAWWHFLLIRCFPTASYAISHQTWEDNDGAPSLTTPSGKGLRKSRLLDTTLVPIQGMDIQQTSVNQRAGKHQCFNLKLATSTFGPHSVTLLCHTLLFLPAVCVK